MDLQRAQEIMTSSVMANVVYNQSPVYIQSVDVQTGQAKIYPVNQPENEKTVPLENLVEWESTF